MKALSIEEIKKRLFDVHGDVVSLDESTYSNVRNKARFIDVEFGEWWPTVDKVLNSKQGHPKRYGTQKLTIEEIKLRLLEIHDGNVVLDESTYTNLKTKARFIDKDYGEWWAHPLNIINHKKGHRARQNEKKKQTWQKNYGVNHPSQNKEILQKILKSSNQSVTLKHWKTNEDVVCTGSYERKVVEMLNETRQDFDWQIIFDMPDGRKYFIDLYLKDRDTYIEIKGYFRKDAKEKWDWFHKAYPNSELWNEKKLKEMEII